MVTVICGIKKSLPCTEVLGFIACRVISKVIGIGAVDCSWGDVKQLIWEISSTSSDVSENQSIVYTSACI